MAEERLQKILSRAGIASRRKAEELIATGRVRVDGEVVRTLGSKVDPTRSRIEVDGRLVAGPEPLAYWLCHKPVGVVSTASDPQGRPTVLSLLPPEERRRLYPVGRLDLDSEGLILLTNDGELAYALTHPGRDVEKVYRVWVQGTPPPGALARLRRGMLLDDGPTRPATVRVVGEEPGRTVVEVGLREGRKRQIRRMFAAVGHPVERLVRIRMGPLELGTLPPGRCRPLLPAEVAALREAVALQPPPPVVD